MRLSAAVHRWVSGQTGPRPLALVRIVVAAAALAKAFDVRRTLVAVLDPSMMRFPYVSWLPDLPVSAVPVFVMFWAVAAVALLLGYRTRIAGSVLTGVLGYVLLLDHQTFGNNHYLLTLVVLLLTVGDSGACLSMDARREGARETIPAWPVQLLKIQVTLVYGFAVVAKLNGEYVSGRVLSSVTTYGVIPIPDAWRIVAVMAGVAAASVLVETVLTFALWSPRLRTGAVLLGLGLHTSIVLFTGAVVELTIFAMVTTSLYLLFFDLRPLLLPGRVAPAAASCDDPAPIVSRPRARA